VLISRWPQGHGCFKFAVVQQTGARDLDVPDRYLSHVLGASLASGNTSGKHVKMGLNHHQSSCQWEDKQ
jgi:hypothetical protein